MSVEILSDKVSHQLTYRRVPYISPWAYTLVAVFWGAYTRVWAYTRGGLYAGSFGSRGFRGAYTRVLVR